jgi:hypothetical protein
MVSLPEHLNLGVAAPPQAHSSTLGTHTLLLVHLLRLRVTFEQSLQIKQHEGNYIHYKTGM